MNTLTIKLTLQELEEVLTACGALDRGSEEVEVDVLDDAINKLIDTMMEARLFGNESNNTEHPIDNIPLPEDSI